MKKKATGREKNKKKKKKKKKKILLVWRLKLSASRRGMEKDDWQKKAPRVRRCAAVNLGMTGHK